MGRINIKGMKNWLKKQFTANSKNLKAIGIGFLWAVGVSAVLGMIGLYQSSHWRICMDSCVL